MPYWNSLNIYMGALFLQNSTIRYFNFLHFLVLLTGTTFHNYYTQHILSLVTFIIFCTIYEQNVYIYNITHRTRLSNYGSSEWLHTILFNAKCLPTFQSNPQQLPSIPSKLLKFFPIILLTVETHEFNNIWLHELIRGRLEIVSQFRRMSQSQHWLM